MKTPDTPPPEKACPFCGSAATFDETEGSQASGSLTVYRARCERYSCAESPWQASRSEAEDWWNNRTPSPTDLPRVSEAMVEAILPVLRTAYACGYTDRPDDRDFSDNRERLLNDLRAALSGPAGGDAGVCAFDLDECTVTLALDSEEQVRAMVATMPAKNRVRLAHPGPTTNPKPGE